MIASESDKEIIEQTLIKSIEENKLNKRKIIIFGCTLYARDIRDKLFEHGLFADAFVDNDFGKVGQKCLGLYVYLPETYLLPYDKNIVIIICSKYCYEMNMQVRKLGYKKNNIINIPVQECLSNTESGDQAFEQAKAVVEEGYKLYRFLIEGQKKGVEIFTCPYPGTGDVYMACSLLEYYLQRKSITNYLVVVVGDSCKRAAALFDIPNIKNIRKEEMEKLLKAWEFLGTERMRVKPLLYWGWRTKRYLFSNNYQQITFNEMFQYDVFEFPYLMKTKQIRNRADSQYAEKLFERLGLKKGRTVILAPYASSFVSEMTIQEWEKIAESLQIMGYSVCTNSCGSSEPIIKGTIPIFFPYNEAINVLEYAGGFIALRSGLCEIVSQAKCKMIILYENSFNAARYNFFSLRKMGLSNSVNELGYSDEIVKDILAVWNN